MDVDTRVEVSETDGFPNVDVDCFRDFREFVGERDVDVTVRVFHYFDEFSCCCVCQVDFPLDECLVELFRHFSRFRRNAADDAVVVDEFFENLAWDDAFWRV